MTQLAFELDTVPAETRHVYGGEVSCRHCHQYEPSAFLLRNNHEGPWPDRCGSMDLRATHCVSAAIRIVDTPALTEARQRGHDAELRRCLDQAAEAWGTRAPEVDPDEHPTHIWRHGRRVWGEPGNDGIDEAAVVRRMSGDRSARLTPAEKTAVLARMTAAGHSLASAAHITGITKPDRYHHTGTDTAA